MSLARGSGLSRPASSGGSPVAPLAPLTRPDSAPAMSSPTGMGTFVNLLGDDVSLPCRRRSKRTFPFSARFDAYAIRYHILDAR